MKFRVPLFFSDQEFEPEDLTELIVTLKQLATDSTKSRSKKVWITCYTKTRLVLDFDNLHPKSKFLVPIDIELG